MKIRRLRVLFAALLLMCGSMAFAETVVVDGIAYYVASGKNEATVVSGDNKYSGNVVIPDVIEYGGVEYSVTAIGDYAFRECSGLTGITLPEGLTAIGDYAFYYCNNLTSITLPESLTTVGYYVFDSCFKLCEVYNKSSLTLKKGSSDYGYVAYYAKNVYTEDGGSKLKQYGDYLFYVDGDDIDLIAYSGDESLLTLPDSYEGKSYDIADFAFAYSFDLTVVTIPEGVTSIGQGAFFDCIGLTALVLPESLAAIGENAFEYCYKLFEVYNKSAFLLEIGSEDYGYVAYYAKNIYTEEGGNKLKLYGDYLFYVDGGNNDLVAYSGSETSLTLPDSFQGESYNVGVYAFIFNTKITDVTLTDGVTAVANHSFYGCTSLKDITFSESVTSIGRFAFYECSSLTDITVPEGVTTIEYCAFYNCTGLTSVALPESLISIGDYAFAYCSGLTGITVPEGVTTIGESAFTMCVNVTDITLPESLISIGDYAFSDCSCLTGITIPEGMASIGKGVFSYCSAMTGITLPDSLNSIGERAFYRCINLTDITLPDSLNSIGDNAFNYCYRLSEVYNKSSLVLEAGLMDYGRVAYYAMNVYTEEGGSKLGRYGDYLFYADGDSVVLVSYSGSETSLILPDSYEGKSYDIGDFAFFLCENITTVTLPEGVTAIGTSAFENCFSLTAVNLPESLTAIDDWAFSGCGKLYEVYNESSLTLQKGSSDYGYVAYYARNIYTEEGGSRLKQSGDYLFYVIGDSINLIAYTGSETSLILPDSFEGKSYNIGDYAFSDCSYLTSITIPESVTSVGDYAFSMCKGLTGIDLPDSLKTIGDEAFSDCTGLTGITIPDGVTYIGEGAFSYCTGLTSITIPDGVKTITARMFTGCSGLIRITLPDGLTSIGYDSFYGCSGLSSITIPESVTTIDDWAFSMCNNLTDITIPEGVTSIGTYTFSNCLKLNKITLPEGLTSIGKGAFYKCIGLTDITLPESVTTIGDYVFYECYSLTDVYCYATEIPATGTDVFYGVDLENSKLYVPSESVDNYKTTHPWSGFAYILPLDEETDVPDVKSSSLLISSADGVINISGGKDGMVVYAYTLDGVVVGSALIENGSASIAASVPDGSLLIISMGDEYTKVMM